MIYVLVIYILFPNYPQVLYTLEELKRLIFGIGTVFSLVGIFGSSVIFFDYKMGSRHIKGVNSELNQMKLTLNDMKKRVKELQKCKTTDHENKEFRIVSVDDKAAIKSYQDEFDLYYNCGYNEDKYRKYYDLGCLSQRLGSKYSKKEIEQIEEYLENNKQVSRSSKKRVLKK